jgi:hypothetical protein
VPVVELVEVKLVIAYQQLELKTTRQTTGYDCFGNYMGLSSW